MSGVCSPRRLWSWFGVKDFGFWVFGLGFRVFVGRVLGFEARVLRLESLGCGFEV